MKTILRTTLAMVAVALICSTCSFADAAADYKAKCAMCHGATGAADTVMGKNLKIRDFSSPDVQKQSDAELAEIVTKGKRKMPSFDGKLTKEQIDGLVKWIRTLKK